jgi:thiamine biosynthesis lipoprotein
MNPPLNRRQFFRSARLAQAAGETLAALDADGLVSGQHLPARTELLSVSRRAMACQFDMLVPAAHPDALAAAEAALDEIDRLEAQLTVYRDTSEVSRLNRLAAHAPVPVEKGLFDLLALSARLSAETEGAFDITAHALIQCWGFFRGPRRVPAPAEREAALENVGMHQVALDPEQRTVHFRRRGLGINLGSIGKGYALDCVARLLRADWQLSSALLHGGHSSVYALGAPAHDPEGWTVGICDPRDPTYRIARVRLKDRALGTSSATFQYLEHEGRKLGHLLDPRSGWPAEGMLGASVVAPTAAEADALATAFFILGVDKARAYCAAHPEIGALLLPPSPMHLPLRIVPLGRLDGEIYPFSQPLPCRSEYDE